MTAWPSFYVAGGASILLTIARGQGSGTFTQQERLNRSLQYLRAVAEANELDWKGALESVERRGKIREAVERAARPR